MAPRPEDDALTESELAELKRNLFQLSGPHVQNFYQQLVTTWKVLHGVGIEIGLAGPPVTPVGE